MEGAQKILMALDVLEEKSNLSPDSTIELEYILEHPVLFDFLSEEDETLLLNKLHKEKVINLFEGRDPVEDTLYKREIKINIGNLRSYRNILLPPKDNKDLLKSIILPDTKWEQFRVRFLDGHNIEVSVNDRKARTNYNDLGFENKKELRPNAQWNLFRELSENNGEVFWEDQMASDKIKKQKQLLSSLLKKCFGINDDPFYPYKQEKSYRMKLLFLSESAKVTTIKNHDKRFDDLNAYMENSTPSI